ncbi:MAG: hypothetical protein H7222_13535 [Methylotenera sp.]|nr:hypothetical protein [Oligoflexia bacterium]
MKFTKMIQVFCLFLASAPLLSESSVFAGDCMCHCEMDWVKVEEGQCAANVQPALVTSGIFGAIGLTSTSGGSGCPLAVPNINSFEPSACDLCYGRIQGGEWAGSISQWNDIAKQKQLCFAASGSQDIEVARKWNGRLRVKGWRKYTGDHDTICSQYTNEPVWMRRAPDGLMNLDCQKIFADETPCKNGGTGTSKANCTRGVFGTTDSGEALYAAGASSHAMNQVDQHGDGDSVSKMDSLATGNLAVAGSVGSLAAPKAALNPAAALSNLQAGRRFPGRAQSGGGSSSGSSGLGTSGSGMGMGNSDSAAVDPNSLMATGGVEGSSYSNGGGAGGRGAGKTGGAAFGGFGGGSGSGAADQMNFGRNPASLGGEDALNGQDPEDYFMRIGASESLFKKVESRYRVKSIHWARSNLAEMK